MSCINKFLALSFVFFLLSSLFVFSVTPVNVQAVDKPSVPQFSVKLIDESYDVPPSTTTTVDQYTGKETTITTPGYHKDQRKFEVTIKNRLFTQSTNENGDKYMLYYHVEYKGHFGDGWQQFERYTFQSNLDYTVITSPPHYSSKIPAAGSQIDFRVEAIIGQSTADKWWFTWVYYLQGGQPQFYENVVSSGWSSVLTFTIPEHGEPPSPTIVPSQTATLPSPTITSGEPQQSPDQSPSSSDRIFTNPVFLFAVSTLIVSVIVAVIMTLHKRQLKTSDYKTR
jgi:hypothetical protein